MKVKVFQAALLSLAVSVSFGTFNAPTIKAEVEPPKASIVAENNNVALSDLEKEELKFRREFGLDNDISKNQKSKKLEIMGCL